MNLFEKIFNYQLTSRLEEKDTFTLTSQERSWLKMMLAHPAADYAFDPGTKQRLQDCIQEDNPVHAQDILVEKAGSTEKQTFLPLLRPIRQIMRNRQAMQLSRLNKYGQSVPMEMGVPWKFDYSMARREWYLHWFNLDRSAPMITRLIHIQSVQEYSISAEQYANVQQKLYSYERTDRYEAVIQVLPIYNSELTRILHAFSCLDKRVEYDEPERTYWIYLNFTGDESEYILNRLRFLGQRVRVTEGDYLKIRMRETARRSLAQYGLHPSSH